METFGMEPQKPKSLSSSVYEMFLFNDHFRPTLEKFKFIYDLIISWQGLIKMASHRHTQAALGSHEWCIVHRLPTLMCHTCQLFPQLVMHEQFFRSKVDFPHVKFRCHMLDAHLCAKTENCVLVFGRLSQVLYVLLLQFQAQRNMQHFQRPFTGI